jgi:hypothetical protein
MQITKTPSPWERVGDVLYWGSLVAGLGLGIFFAVAAAPLGLGWRIVFGAGAFLVCYFGGRAFRYVLARR